MHINFEEEGETLNTQNNEILIIDFSVQNLDHRASFSSLKIFIVINFTQSPSL
jgi:hypothetical protein